MGGLSPTTNLGGRPSRIVDVVPKLEDAFRLGLKDLSALRYAKVPKSTYYKWYEKFEWFRDRMEAAKEYGYIAANNLIMQDIVKEKNIDTAKWYLERKFKKEYGSQRIELTGEEGEPIRLNILAGVGFMPPKEQDAQGSISEDITSES